MERFWPSCVGFARNAIGEQPVKRRPKLSYFSLVAVLLGGMSAHALERVSYQQLAQVDEERVDEDGGAPPDEIIETDPGEASSGDGSERGDRRSRRRGEEGGSPARVQHEDPTTERQQRERPARRDRDAEVPPRERSAPAPAESVNDEAQPEAEESAPASTEKAPPAEEPATAAEPSPAPKAEEPAEPAAERPRRKKQEEPVGPESDAPAAPAPGEVSPDAPAAKEGADTPRRRDRKAAEPAEPPAVAPSEVKDLKELKAERKERTEDGGKRVVIQEPDNRTIVKEGGRTIIRADETERFRRLGGKTRREKRDGVNLSISIRPGGIEIFTETDDRGRALRRYRRDRKGREVILFDNRDYYRRHRDGSFADAIVDLPPPRVKVPRGAYIVDYGEASDVDVYDALSAPPVERLDRAYSLEEVRWSPSLRSRMRRVDLDVINFEFGAWDVAPGQYSALERIADAMNRVIDRNPDEMFLIEGHTDAVGSDDDNLSLSDRRAETVAIILTEEFGVPPENMTTQGYGEQYLKIDTQEAERQNRRVAVRRITPLMSRAD